MYKEASKQKLRVTTDKGLLSVEQLWDLKVTELDKIAVNLEQDYKVSKGKSFIVKKTVKDKTIKLKFDIVLDILTTKLKENDTLLSAKNNKEYNEKIMSIIANKQDDALVNLSIEELEKRLK